MFIEDKKQRREVEKLIDWMSLNMGCAEENLADARDPLEELKKLLGLEVEDA